MLSATFEEAGDYTDMVPIVGYAPIAYLTGKRVVGLCKLVRVLYLYVKRLQTRERLTSQIADTIFDSLQPRGLVVGVKAQHICMTTHRAYKPHSPTSTQRLLVLFRTDAPLRKEVLAALGFASILSNVRYREASLFATPTCIEQVEGNTELALKFDAGGLITRATINKAAGVLAFLSI